MAQIYVEVEENPNCDYSPQQTFQTLEPPRRAAALLVNEGGGRSGARIVVGWSSDGGGRPCPVTYARVMDSGAGVSLLVSGGDYGIRVRPADDSSPWSVDDHKQRGEPYMLLDPAIEVAPLDSPYTG